MNMESGDRIKELEQQLSNYRQTVKELRMRLKYYEWEFGKYNPEFHIAYKTTNTITGEYYIGRHSTYNLRDGYLGSGNKIKESIRKYGEENHSRVILGYGPDKENLRKAELRYLNEEKEAKNPLCLNIQGVRDMSWSDDIPNKMIYEIEDKK